MNLLFITIFLIMSVLAVLFAKREYIKERFGDYQIRKATNALLASEDYYLIKDIAFITPGGQQKFSFLIISQFGLFTVTTYQYSGVIAGAEHDAIWSQEINKKKVTQFENPSFKLNKNTHVLCNTLGLSRNTVFPVVLFLGIRGFKTTMRSQVTFGKEYLRYIQSKTKVLFNPKELENIIKMISTKKEKTNTADSQTHFSSVPQSTLKSVTENTCPTCGSGMEIREVSNSRKILSQMLVCQLYPTCRPS